MITAAEIVAEELSEIRKSELPIIRELLSGENRSICQMRLRNGKYWRL